MEINVDADEFLVLELSRAQVAPAGCDKGHSHGCVRAVTHTKAVEHASLDTVMRQAYVSRALVPRRGPRLSCRPLRLSFPLCDFQDGHELRVDVKPRPKRTIGLQQGDFGDPDWIGTGRAPKRISLFI